MSALLEIDGLNKSFGTLPVLRDLSLDVAAGEVVSVCGASGSGKSTLLRCINGLEDIDSGSIRFEGAEVPRSRAGLRALRRHIGMVFQSFNLFPHLTALQNISLGPRRILGKSSGEAREAAQRLLERVGLADKADAFPDFLSGGQQQRVAIARALAMQPSLMLFDEPTSALDPEMVAEVLDVMRGLAGQGMTMVIVSHEMNFAREVADRVAFMHAGMIVEVAPPAEFFRAPKSEEARRFVRTVVGQRISVEGGVG
ncbi:amino acid ABC transporter ATP-binding protein [Reyranella sp.]|uniref:amino acid ABC transporter ATP-binding protein n=1 Tax=Reyranella sp. TaxID=1929291 RepID=UPI003BAA0D61